MQNQRAGASFPGSQTAVAGGHLARGHALPAHTQLLTDKKFFKSTYYMELPFGASDCVLRLLVNPYKQLKKKHQEL